MEKQYQISESKFLEAKIALLANGGEIDGSRFEISGVEGTVSYVGGVLRVNITDKPFLASWEMISDKLDEFFS